MIQRFVREPCLCGDPECSRCFSTSYRWARDPDEVYDEERQREIDDAILEDKHDGEREERG